MEIVQFFGGVSSFSLMRVWETVFLRDKDSSHVSINLLDAQFEIAKNKKIKNKKMSNGICDFEKKINSQILQTPLHTQKKPFTLA